MKPRFVIVTLVILALAIPAMMLAQQSKAEKEVQATLEQLRQANVKGGAEGAAIFDKYLGDDFLRILNRGVYTKAETLEAIRTGKQHTESQDLTDVKIRIYGNTAVATGVLNAKSAGPLAASDTLAATHSRFTRVFVKRGGIWQCVLFQTTLIAAPTSAQATGKDAPPSYVANPANYKVIGENDLFRVILETKPVGFRDVLHSHLDSAVYLLTDCHQRTYLPDGNTREGTREKGSVVWQAAMAHSTENIGTSECVMVLVERK
jgi:ketosteroid isomerase-like protein